MALTAWRVEESRRAHAAPPDWAGFALLDGGLVGLIYGLIRAGESSGRTPAILACLVGCVLSSVRRGRARVGHPMFDLALFRKPTFAGVCSRRSR